MALRWTWAAASAISGTRDRDRSAWMLFLPPYFFGLNSIKMAFARPKSHFIKHTKDSQEPITGDWPNLGSLRPREMLQLFQG